MRDGRTPRTHPCSSGQCLTLSLSLSIYISIYIYIYIYTACVPTSRWVCTSIYLYGGDVRSPPSPRIVGSIPQSEDYRGDQTQRSRTESGTHAPSIRPSLYRYTYVHKKIYIMIKWPSAPCRMLQRPDGLEELENIIVLCSKYCFISRGKYFLGNFFLSPFSHTVVIINVVFW